jgi:type IX secretion system PorP/SprF family membrane protein
MKNAIFTILLVLIVSSLQAQNLNSHYLYQMNHFNINPAITGNTEGVKAIVNSGAQWVGMEGNPTNSMLGVHSQFKDNMGVGGKINVNKAGNFSTITAEFAYSYKAIFKPGQSLSFGLTAGYYQSRLKTDDILNNPFTDVTDKALSGGYNESQFISGAGFLFKHKKLELGLSAPHLIIANKTVSDHVFVTAKFTQNISEAFSIKPLVVYQNRSINPSILDVGMQVDYNELVWLQYSYRTNKTSLMALGVNIANIQLGYAYTMPQNHLSTISSGAHELLFTLNINKKKGVEVPTEQDPLIRRNTETRLKNEAAQQNKKYRKLSQEMNELLTELTQLVGKQKAGDVNTNDTKRIAEISKRVEVIKSELK